MKLPEAKQNETVEIIAVKAPPRLLRRFYDLGFVKGNQVRPAFVNPFGNMKAYWIQNSLIALRNDDGARIEVKICGRQ